jgi:hypothetical protein
MDDGDDNDDIGKKMGISEPTERLLGSTIGYTDYRKFTSKLERFISETNGFTGKWNPVTRTWKLVPSGVAKYILWHLYDRKIAKRQYEYPKYPRYKVCIDHDCDYGACTYGICKEDDKILNLFRKNKVGPYEVYACYVSATKEYTLKYTIPGRTQVLNCDLLLKDGKLSITDRAEICHAFLNVEITQADLDSYDPERLDTYLYEIFDENNYATFKELLIKVYWHIYFNSEYIISANKQVKLALTHLIKRLFGVFCFTNIHKCGSYFPRLFLAPMNKVYVHTVPSRIHYEISYAVVKIGACNSRDVVDIHTKDVESLDPVPRSTIVKLALDIASHKSEYPQEIKYHC